MTLWPENFHARKTHDSSESVGHNVLHARDVLNEKSELLNKYSQIDEVLVVRLHEIRSELLDTIDESIQLELHNYPSRRLIQQDMGNE